MPHTHSPNHPHPQQAAGQPAAGADIVIEARGLAFEYEANRPVLTGVDLSVTRGDYVAMLGPNGGGKTTLLKILLGLLSPGTGSVRVLGEKPRLAARHIGYVPQHTFTNRAFPVTVTDMVLMGRLGLTARGVSYSRRDKELAQSAIERVGMAEHAGRRAGNLSGGQRQRAAIARALVSEPDILFLDEPTASVDAGGKCALLDLLEELNADGMTVVYVSHDLSVVAGGVHSVACVNKTLHFHAKPEITRSMMEMMYGGETEHTCPVELFTHGHVPHRVVTPHEGAECRCADCNDCPPETDGGE